jgi:hypothetical protein
MHRDTLAMRGEIFARLPGEVAQAVGDHLRTHFQVTGIAPVSLHDIDRRFGEMTATMMGMLTTLQTSSTAVPAEVPVENIDRGAAWWGQWDWADGRMTHFIPRGWHWPSGITVKALWDLWFFGNILTTVRPYTYIPKRDLETVSERQAWDRGKTVIGYLERLILFAEPRILPVGIDAIWRLDMMTNDRLFNIVYSSLMERLYSVGGVVTSANLARKAELAYSTVHKNLLRKDEHGEVTNKRIRIQ